MLAKGTALSRSGVRLVRVDSESRNVELASGTDNTGCSMLASTIDRDGEGKERRSDQQREWHNYYITSF